MLVFASISERSRGESHAKHVHFVFWSLATLLIPVRSAQPTTWLAPSMAPSPRSIPTTKTMVVKTKDGTEHTIHFVDKTTVHGVPMPPELARRTLSTASKKAPKLSLTTR